MYYMHIPKFVSRLTAQASPDTSSMSNNLIDSTELGMFIKYL
jgi:hypothetical protein